MFAFSYKNYDVFVCSIPRALKITCVFLCEVFIPFNVCAQSFKKMLPSSAKTPHYANMPIQYAATEILKAKIIIIRCKTSL